MSHKYRAAIGRESLRPASRGIFAQLEPRRRNLLRGKFRLPRAHRWEGSNFCGKDPGFAACREMPASLLAGKGFLPRECRRHSGWLPGIRQKGAADSSADKLLARFGRAARISIHSHGCLRPRPLTRASKDAKRPFPPAPSKKCLRHFLTVPNQLGGVRLSSCGWGAEGGAVR